MKYVKQRKKLNLNQQSKQGDEPLARERCPLPLVTCGRQESWPCLSLKAAQ